MYRDYSATVLESMRALRACVPTGAIENAVFARIAEQWVREPSHRYNARCVHFDRWFEQRRELGVQAVADGIRAWLLFAVDRAMAILPQRMELAPVFDLYHKAFALILNAAVRASDQALDPDRSDLLLKDFSVVLLRSIPTGTMLVEPLAAVPRRPLLTGRHLQERLQGVVTLMQMGRNRPFFEQHLYDRFLPSLTPQGWRDCLRRTRLLFEQMPEIRGITGGGWLWDPALDAVDDRISFLRRIPALHGARFVRTVGPSWTKDAALTGSARRTQAYSEGRYAPQAFMLIWLREDFMAMRSEDP
jgi:hypothetical protein